VFGDASGLRLVFLVSAKSLIPKPGNIYILLYSLMLFENKNILFLNIRTPR
jgi:hypothetical protein